MTRLNKLSPVLVVNEIDDRCIQFWTQLGFAKTIEVPHHDQRGFVILAKEGVEIMYQSCASAAADVPPLGEEPSRSSLYIEVENLDEIVAALKGVKPIIPRRRSSYGSDEFFVREPGGNIIGFAQPGPTAT